MKKILFILLTALALIPFTSNAKNAVETITEWANTNNSIINYSNKGIRYIGANPNNYVSFNGELWRIIGVVDGKLKIIRNEPFFDQSSNPIRYAWDSTDSSVNEGHGVNEWSTSKLQIELNTDYLNTSLTSNPYWYNDGFNRKNNIFDRNQVLSSEAQKLMTDATWYTGSPNNGGNQEIDYRTITAEVLYDGERSNKNGRLCENVYFCDSLPRTTTWTGKVGLIYPSDYAYSTSGNETTSREACLNATITDWSNDCKNNAWLNNSWYPSYTITPNSNISQNGRVYYIDYGRLISSGTSSDTGLFIFPTVYLKDGVSFTGTEGEDGTQDHPYTLALKVMVNYNSNGGSEVPSQSIDPNTKASEPNNPNKTNYVFAGWYIDEELTNEFNFDTNVFEDITLYAKWVAKSNSTDDIDANDNREVKGEEEIENPRTGVNNNILLPILIVLGLFLLLRILSSKSTIKHM